jgi:AcrR family transcriptional regulator
MMPTQTFWSLPSKKRAKLQEIALEEFANNDFSVASVSRVVAKAGIAKGSLYQYFTDKEELFLYLVELAQQTLFASMQEDPLANADADFYEVLRWQMSATVRAATRYPLHSKLLRRAYTATLPFRERVMDLAQAASKDHFHFLVHRGMAQGDIDPTLDPEVVAFVIRAAVSEVGPFLVARLGMDTQQTIDEDALRFGHADAERVFDQLIEIFRRGLAIRHR